MCKLFCNYSSTYKRYQYCIPPNFTHWRKSLLCDSREQANVIMIIAWQYWGGNCGSIDGMNAHFYAQVTA